MWKSFLRGFCILFTISHISGLEIKSINCCDLLEVFFRQKCVGWQRSKFEQVENTLSFKCFLFPMKTILSNQEIYRQFDGSFIPKNYENLKSCSHQLNNSRNSLILEEHRHLIYTIEVCNLHVHSVEIYTNETMELSYINDVALHAPNITELIWHMHKKCQPVNDIIVKFKHLISLKLKVYASSVELNKCEDFSFNGTQLTELHVYLMGPSSYESVKLTNCTIPAGFLRDMRSLNKFKLNCASKEFIINLPIEIFQGLRNLEVLSLINCSFANLSTMHFQDLTNLRLINVSLSQFDGFDWLSSKILENHVTDLDFLGTTTKNANFDNFLLPYFKTYKNLLYLAIQNNLARDYDLVGNVCNEKGCHLLKDRFGTKCPDGFECTFERFILRIHINCLEPKAVIELKALPIATIGKTILYLENLNLNNLPNTSIDGYSNISIINASGNKLVDLTVSNLPESLIHLDISNNSLTDLRPEVLKYLEQRKDTLEICLSNNSWSCPCYTSDFLKFLQSYSEMIVDYKSITCDHMSIDLKLDQCRTYTIYLILFLSALVLVVCTCALCFRTSILMWLYYHNILANCIRRTAKNIDIPKRYDAFLAFSHKNMDLVNEYVDQLENGRRRFKLCYYHRDWLIGESIVDYILKSIDESKCVIVLMTKMFVKSSWGSFEFRTAIRASSMDRNKRLIVIVYPDLEDFSDLDSELRMFLKYHTYLRRDDTQFWQKLIYVLPHIKPSKPKKATRKACVEDSNTV